MNYLQFVFIFLFLPAVIIFFKFPFDSIKVRGLIIHSVIALIYTVPWDSYLIYSKIWYYDINLITDTFLLIPIGEYFFITLQTAIICSVISPKKFDYEEVSFKFSFIGIFLALILFITGIILFQFAKAKYLALILMWASFPLGVQYSFGANILLFNISIITKYLLIFSIYFSFIDTIALDRIWFISESTSLGLKIANLPIEEIAFFCFTSLFLIQGMCLWFKLKFNENI